MNLVRREVIVQVVAGVVLLLLTALGSYTLGTISGALRKSIGITAWETDKSENGTFFDLRCEYRWVTNQNLGMFGDYWALRPRGKYIFYPVFIHDDVIATSYDSLDGKANAYWIDYDHRGHMRNRNNPSNEFTVSIEKKCQI